MSFYSGGEPKLLKPSWTGVAFSLLAAPNKECKSAWILAKGGINNNGPLLVQLTDEYGKPFTDEAYINSSQVSRVKFSKCSIPASAFPPVVQVRAKNRSTVQHSDAAVWGILLEYTDDETAE